MYNYATSCCKNLYQGVYDCFYPKEETQLNNITQLSKDHLSGETKQPLSPTPLRDLLRDISQMQGHVEGSAISTSEGQLNHIIQLSNEILSGETKQPLSPTPNNLGNSSQMQKDVEESAIPFTEDQLNPITQLSKDLILTQQSSPAAGYEELYERSLSSKELVNELVKDPILRRKVWRSADNFILLTAHDDHKVIDVQMNNLNWIKEKYTTILVESVPCIHKNTDVLQYLNEFCTQYAIDVSSFETLIGKKFLFKDPLDIKHLEFPSKIDEKLRVLTDIFDQTPFEKQPELRILNLIFFTLKSFNFYKMAISEGIEVMGCEPQKFFPGKMSEKERELSMLDVMNKCNKEGKKIFFNVGAFHGINMIETLKKSAGRVNTSFTHLIVNPHIDRTKSKFLEWKNNKPSNWSNRPHLKLTTVKFDQDTSTAEQDITFINAAKIMLREDCNRSLQYKHGCDLFKAKEYTHALTHLLLAFDYFTEQSDALSTAICHSTMASCYRDLGDIDTAIIHCESALMIFKNNNIQNQEEVDRIEIKLKGLIELKEKNLREHKSI